MNFSSDNNPTLTVVSPSFPPQVSGSTILLANLLSSYTGKLNAIAGYDRYSKSDPTFSPPCPTVILRPPSTFPVLYDRLSRRFPGIVCLNLRNSIRNRLTELRSKVVLAAFPYGVNLVASFLAARQLNLPFYAHMHDLWMEQTPVGTVAYRFAQRWEPTILRNATRVLCMTEAMQKHYENKYNLRTDLLPHCIPEQNLFSAPGRMGRPKMVKPTVLFVGAVQAAMNLDSLKTLARASELLPSDHELLYCTSTDMNALNHLGIQSSRLRVKYVTRTEVQRLQSEAHVLVAPLSHRNCTMDEVRTVFSTKLLEYLVSGRPIVVFAPKDSYHAVSASKRGWGYLVTEDSPAALAAAIEKVVRDETLAAKLVDGALREARSRRAKIHARRLFDWVLTDTNERGYFGVAHETSEKTKSAALYT